MIYEYRLIEKFQFTIDLFGAPQSNIHSRDRYVRNQTSCKSRESSFNNIHSFFLNSLKVNAKLPIDTIYCTYRQPFVDDTALNLGPAAIFPFVSSLSMSIPSVFFPVHFGGFFKGCYVMLRYVFKNHLARLNFFSLFQLLVSSVYPTLRQTRRTCGPNTHTDAPLRCSMEFSPGSFDLSTCFRLLEMFVLFMLILAGEL